MLFSVTWKSWHFRPGVHAKWDASSAEKLNRFRSLSCVVPVPPEAATPPSVSWYKDGFPVGACAAVARHSFVSLPALAAGAMGDRCPENFVFGKRNFWKIS